SFHEQFLHGMKIELPGGAPAEGSVDVLHAIQQADVTAIIHPDAKATVALALVTEREAVGDVRAAVPNTIHIYILDLLDAAREDRRGRRYLVFGIIALQRDLQVLKVPGVELGVAGVESMGKLLQEAGVADPHEEGVGEIGQRLELLDRGAGGGGGIDELDVLALGRCID